MQSNKFCVDCKYYHFAKFGRWSREQHVCKYEYVPDIKYIDIVTGENKTAIGNYYNSAYAMREDKEKCGTEGKYWELKE